ncbi:multiple inositol polyphosphate phosphatase 1 [Nilaparvata lugens]|uniref:multiple inositol polyphosphate phosphatase 1 n=1 Tax=Nilaparvata lugens TaxID=108931 RepID=UPI00193DA187|nr:multiple inositol polyphosphate phosphatase 1 [Nilaparvata lugens]
MAEWYHHVVVVILSLVSILNAVEFDRKEVCYATNQEPYLHFASKTAYEFVYGKKKYQPIPNCTPKQVWILARHGTRYPSQEEIVKLRNLLKLRDIIVRNHEERRTGSLCEKDIENFKEWHYNVAESEEKNLTIQGWNEHRLLAMRIKTNFHGILGEPYSPEKFTIVSTNTSRTMLSAKAFIEGMFGDDTTDIPEVVINNTVIKAYKGCDRWKKEVSDNPKTDEEMTLFNKGSIMDTVVANVSNRLGFLNNLTEGDLQNMFSMCAFGKAWDYYKVSPWCAAFTTEELKVSLPLNYTKSAILENKFHQQKLNCLLYFYFRRLANNEPEKNGVFYFTHSTAVNSVLTRLGIAKDPFQLKHDNYYSSLKRKWQISLIGPFSANLQAIFYKCTDGEENRVSFFLNEHLVNYEGCDVGLCSWRYLQKKLQSVVDPSSCNRDFCFYSSSSTVATNLSAIFSCLLFVYSVMNYLT